VFLRFVSCFVLTSVLAASFCVSSATVSAQSQDTIDLCDYGRERTEDRFFGQQQEFEPALDALVNKPTVATVELVALGMENLRKYRARLEKICADVVQYNRLEKDNKCLQKNQGAYEKDVAFCWHYVDVEMKYQQAVFEQAMLADAGKKKISYLVNKYKELNKKFASLLDLAIGVHNGLAVLNSKIGKFVAEMCETGG